MTILWNKQSGLAAVVSAVTGLATGLGVWLGTAQALFGEVSVDSTGQTLPCLYGTVASALSPLLYTVILSLLWPDNYDWTRFKEEKLLLDSDTQNEESDREEQTRQNSKGGVLSNTSEVVYDKTDLRWKRYALFWSLFSFFGLWVLWPLPMYGAKYIFSKIVSFVRYHKRMWYLITSTVLQVMDCGVTHMAVDKSTHTGRVSIMGWQETNFESIKKPKELITVSLYKKKKNELEGRLARKAITLNMGKSSFLRDAISSPLSLECVDHQRRRRPPCTFETRAQVFLSQTKYPTLRKIA